MPETKTIATHVPINNIDWPISGWLAKKITKNKRTKKLKKYDAFDVLKSSLESIFAIIRIKKGLINSIGCSLKKYKFNHLFDPLTSTPISGTNINKIRRKINMGTNKPLTMGNFTDEIKIIKKIEIKANTKCFEKKK